MGPSGLPPAGRGVFPIGRRPSDSSVPAPPLSPLANLSALSRQVVTEILDDLQLGDYEIKLNHRRLLDAMLAIAGACGGAGGEVHACWRFPRGRLCRSSPALPPPPTRPGRPATPLACPGVPASKFRAICAAIDKLYKEPWEAVRREMVEDKGLAPAMADTIGQFVVLRWVPGGRGRLLSGGEGAARGRGEQSLAAARPLSDNNG